MSRVARRPLDIPSGVEFKQDNNLVTVKGPNGQLAKQVNKAVSMNQDGSQVSFMLVEGSTAKEQVGTAQVVVSNMVHGVSKGFEKKLQLVGVGYRAKTVGKILDLTLGFSHPVVFEVPEGITIETPYNTEVVIKGVDKEQVGQIAANIRSIRPPESYKGKGVRYSDERIILKETKKK